MPRVENIPPALAPYAFHGMELRWDEHNSEAIGTCPVCMKEGKLYINKENGLFNCKVCGAGSDKGGGNIYTFLKLLLEHGSEEGAEELARDRGLLSWEPIIEWGLRRSPLTGEWLVPGYNIDGSLVQVYRYQRNPVDNRMVLMATTGLGHGIHGMNLYREGCPDLYICEGIWDGLALYEALRVSARAEHGGLCGADSGNPSLLNAANVIAVASCNAFKDGWKGIASGKYVKIGFDSDHPKVNEISGKSSDPAGYAGMRRVAKLLSSADPPPKDVEYLRWGDEGYNPDLKDGYDIRDWLNEGKTATARTNELEELLLLFSTPPEEWQAAKKEDTDGESECLPCYRWSVLIEAWKKAMKWTEGLDRALSCMLASIVSTKAVGDQLWMKILGPASCGKSTLCEALSVNKRYVLAKSTIRGFHSGYKSDADGEEDHSLIAQVNDKTLVTKDGDTLLQAPNLGQILSEARDLYDKTSRTHYRHGLQRDYAGVCMTWLLCGTSSLRGLDSSELGERFLDCVMMDSIDDALEEEILWKVVNRAEKSLAYQSDGKFATQHDPDLARAMQLTGGYVGYLRGNAQMLLKSVIASDEVKHQCIKLGKFVAYMRARPSTRQQETAEREFAARLVSQMIRLAKCLAVVLNRTMIDSEVMRRVTRVALDTARGRVLELAGHLYKAGDAGSSTESIAQITGETADNERKLLRFMRRVGAVILFRKELSGGGKGQPVWRLSQNMAKLYKEVMIDE